MDTDAFFTRNPTDQDLTSEPSSEQATSMQDFDKYLTGAYDYQAPQHGDIRQGVVVEINENGVIMDIGSKREGFVPAEDMSRLDEEVRSTVQVGATIPVFVLRPADKEGRPVLSIHQAHMYQDWLRAEEMMKGDELYEGEVSGHNRGGLIVKFGRIRGFVPASQVVGLPRRLREEQRRQRLAAMIGQKLGLKIIEVDRRRRRLIFSQRRALRAWQDLQRERVIEQLNEGETRHGKVTSITDFGAFVDLGGADGLVHVSELSWKRVEHPREVLRVGDEVDVYVLNVDRQRKRIALSIKKLQPDPWTMVEDHYKVSQLVGGRVTRVLDFGAFVALDLGIEGLLHAREMIGTPELSPSDIVQPGDVLPVKIVGIDSRRRRIDLSAKQVRQDEWERWMAEQQVAQEEEAATEEEIVAEVAVVPEAIVASAIEGGIEEEAEEVVAEVAAVPEAIVASAIEGGIEEEAEEVVAEVAVVPEAVVASAIEGGVEEEAEDVAVPAVAPEASIEGEEEVAAAETAEAETSEPAGELTDEVPAVVEEAVAEDPLASEAVEAASSS